MLALPGERHRIHCGRAHAVRPFLCHPAITCVLAAPGAQGFAGARQTSMHTWLALGISEHAMPWRHAAAEQPRSMLSCAALRRSSHGAFIWTWAALQKDR